jgi:RHS repeat-associated protein
VSPPLPVQGFLTFGRAQFNPTPRRLLASLQTCLWAVLALCLGNAWGMRTVDPLDSPKAERPVLSESAEDAGYYFNARWYDAERGAFTGRDAKLQFWSPYNYVGNMPLVGTDPSGMYWDYANMTDAELTMHDNFTSMANVEEMANYDRIADDPSILVTHMIDPSLAEKGFDASVRIDPNIAPHNGSVIPIAFQSTDMLTPDRLVHEMVHVNQYLNQDPLLQNASTRINLEVPAWEAQAKFLDRNGLPMDAGMRRFDLMKDLWTEGQKTNYLMGGYKNAAGY